MRMMDNCSIETDAVKTIQDDLNYYVESNQEPDFAENELMYEDLELEETMSNIYSSTGNWGALSLTQSPPPLSLSPSISLHFLPPSVSSLSPSSSSSLSQYILNMHLLT